MGIPTTGDSSVYLLRLPHQWAVYLIPLVCFYGVLAVWVIRKVLGKNGANNSNGGSIGGNDAEPDSFPHELHRKTPERSDPDSEQHWRIEQPLPA